MLELFRQEIAETVKRSDFDELKKVVAELAEAQKRTEHEVRILVSELRDTKKMVGGLDTVGCTLENSAYKALPGIVERDFGIKIEGRLIRKYVEYSDGRHLELSPYHSSVI